MANDMDFNFLLTDVEAEFTLMGIKKDIDPTTGKTSFNILKRPNGMWFKSTKEGLHSPASVSDLDFSQMPALKKLCELIDAVDSEFNKSGGRIFITDSLVFKIIKGTTTPVLFSEKLKEKKSGRYQKLCDEICEHGLDKDRYRVEETYILTRSPRGEWSMNSSHENHSGTSKVLDLDKMPHLKATALKIYKMDTQFKANGGRLFITSSRVYRVKNKIESDFKL